MRTRCAALAMHVDAHLWKYILFDFTALSRIINAHIPNLII